MVEIKNLDQFRKKLRFFNGLRVDGNQLYESVYLDFDNACISMCSSNIIVRSKFEFGKEDNTPDQSSFYVDLSGLLTISKNFDSLKLEDRTFISSNNDKFKLKHFDDPFDYSPLDSFEETDDAEKFSLPMNVDTVQVIRDAISFMDVDTTSFFHSLFITQNHLVSGNRIKFYQLNLNKFLDTSMDYPDMIISGPFAKMLNMFDSMGEYTFNFTRVIRGEEPATDFAEDLRDQVLYVTVSNSSGETEYEMLVSCPASMLELPDIMDDDGFKKSYNHDNYVVFLMHDLLDSIKMLDPFTSQILNSRAYLQFNEDSSIMRIMIRDSNFIEKVVPVQEVSDSSYFSGIEIAVNLSILKAILSMLRADEVCLKINSDDKAAGINVLNVVYLNDPDPLVHTVYARLQN